jgi:hypothetical protein
MKLRQLVPGVSALIVLASCDPGNDPLSSITAVDGVATEQDAVPLPGIVVVFVESDFSATEDIVGFGWEPGDEVTLTVDYGNDGDIDFIRTSEVDAGGGARFQDYQGGPIPFAATTEGDKVTISSGLVGSATHVVQYLAFGWVDFAGDQVCGYARNGADVSVRVFTTFPEGPDAKPTAGADETWCADFSALIDVVPGDWGWAVTPHGQGHTQFHWYAPLALPVSVDIRPGGDPNTINCQVSAQMIAVAILTTDDFDATTVDHTTVTFEGASEVHVDAKTGQPRRHEEDVDEDGDMDLVFHFRLGDTALTCDATEGTLMGQTFNGTPIEGTDALNVIG